MMALSIVFRIHHNPSGRFVDPTTCKFKMQFLLTVPASIFPCDTFFFERGPESIIRRLQVKDIQGRLLEDIDQYNCLYAITEICTGDPVVRQGRATFGLEGNSAWPDLGGWIKHPTEGLQNSSVKTNNAASNVYSCELSFNLLSGVFGGASKKYIYRCLLWKVCK